MRSINLKNTASVYYRKIQFSYYLIVRRILIKKEGIIIIGCGRSGTTYTSKKFKSLGIDIGHERLKKDGISSWYLVSDQIRVPIGPNYKQIKKLNWPIVHQVREPLKAISSMLAIGRKSYMFLSNEIPIDYEKDSKILKAMKYWYYWNLKAEEKSILTYQIENFDDTLEKLLDIGKFSYNIEKFNVEKSTNTRNHIGLSWNDLRKEDKDLSDKIMSLSIKYGYKV